MFIPALLMLLIIVSDDGDETGNDSMTELGGTEDVVVTFTVVPLFSFIVKQQ